ncbi:MAG: hypothetical protein ACTSWW_12155, partial [Promethearchaeota archaeon]
MATWLVFIGGLILFILLILLWKRAKNIRQILLQAEKSVQTKTEEIEAKNKELEEKEKNIHQQQKAFQKLKMEKNVVEAKYLKKLKAAEVKKKNLAKYHQKKKDIRSIKEQVEDIIGKGPKWLPHSCKEPTSHQIGKPKGAKGGGRKRPEKIHQINDLYPSYCPGCGILLEDTKAYFVYDRILTDLFRERDEVDAYDVLRIRNIKQNIYRRKCPTCKCWVYPDQGLF